MYRNERHNEIIKLLTEKGYMTVEQLSKLLFISESSIRRDLTALEGQRIVNRSYGGAELIKNSTQILPFSTRAHQNIAAKKIMARKACGLIQEGDIVFLDQSSSAFFVACELLKKTNITVVTNNIEILSLLSQSDIHTYSSGGHLSSSNRNCLIGSDAHRIFSEIHADILFFSAKALSEDGIIYDCDREEICLRNTMLSNASRKVFLCSSDKINSHSGYRQCLLSEVDCFITDLNHLENYPNLMEYEGMHVALNHKFSQWIR